MIFLIFMEGNPMDPHEPNGSEGNGNTSGPNNSGNNSSVTPHVDIVWLFLYIFICSLNK
jgi:hypothetical protein